MPRATSDEAPGAVAGRDAARPRYAELETRSNFSFLVGASHPDELVARAFELGHVAACIADTNTLAGVVRAHVAAKRLREQAGGARSVGGVAVAPLAVGCRLLLVDPPGLTLLAYPTHRGAYARLCRLLTIGKRRVGKGCCSLSLHDLLEHADGMHLVLVPPPQLARWADAHGLAILEALRRRCGDRLSIAAHRLLEADDEQRGVLLRNLAAVSGVPLAACNDVHYHDASRRPLQDVLTCIRDGCTIAEAGRRLFPHAERRLKSPLEMARLFAGSGVGVAALERSAEVALAAAEGFSLDELRYEYPDEVVPAGRTPMAHLRERTWLGAAERYPLGVPEKVRRQIEHEFALIDDLGYAKYFLTVDDLCAFARSRRILHQGRGAAANSAVCYCLGVTAVDPDRIDVLFERFVSKERSEPPDIDIDFEHERREEVIQYLYGKYGRDRAALTAEVISYRPRSAVREVGKALGLSLDLVDRLAKDHEWWSAGALQRDRLKQLGVNPEDPTVRRLAALANELLGFPRHLSQHVGGFVITRGPLCELVPVENAAMADRTVIEWDKDDIEAMNMLKVDVLGLGMLTCLRRAMEMVGGAGEREAERKGQRDEGTTGRREEERSDAAVLVSSSALSFRCSVPSSRCPSVPLSLSAIPPEDPSVYDMICAADTVGVFQIESRAQMSMLPRLRPRCFYDLVIEVAIVRPGPIQGQMVHPFLRRRDGREPVVFPDDAVKRVLGKTLGVPLFQEQAMSLAVVAAGFTPGEADALRRAIGAWKSRGNQIAVFGEKLVEGMVSRGYERHFAEQVFTQIKGFSGYGFPESHAASFALLVYASAWMKKHHPAAFAAALINSQPMGFYAPAQIVRDAQEHGVEVRGVDVNWSGWECGLEGGEGRRDNGTKGQRGEGTEGERERDGESGGERGEFQREGILELARGVARSSERSDGSGKRGPTNAESGARSPGIGPALRLGLCMVRGLGEADGKRVEAAVRSGGPFRTIAALRRASGVGVAALRRLASADAFASMGLDRQHAAWEVAAMSDEAMPLFEGVDLSPTERGERPVVSQQPGPPATSLPDAAPLAAILPRPRPQATVARDYAATGLSLRAHPVSFVREALAKRGVRPNSELRDEAQSPRGRSIAVAGIVLVRQRPSTANGVVFVTLEDETASANLIVRPEVWQRHRRAARHSTALVVHGRVERQGAVVHVLARRIEALSIGDPILPRSRDFH